MGEAGGRIIYPNNAGQLHTSLKVSGLGVKPQKV